ncbi:type 1 glutamine amidotransferase [Bdellovibrionota bacterium FG-1]
MRILIIDNTIDTDSWGATEIRELAHTAPGAIIEVRRAPQDDLPRSCLPYDRIILSGSKTQATEQAPWISRLDELIRKAAHESRPILGICYGHQSIARALGGLQTVRQANQGEFGWGKIELTPEGLRSSLTRRLPRSFHTFQWHGDEVCSLPAGAKVLARSQTCDIQCFELEGEAVYGVQFHPERQLEQATKAIAGRRHQHSSIELLNPDLGPKVYSTEIGKTLFHNFLALGSS